MNIEDRAKQVIEQLINVRTATDAGRTRIDSALITEIVRRDQAAVAFAVTRILSSPQAKAAGWSIWLVTAQVYNAEYDDDSLMVLLEAAAAKAGDELPAIHRFTPHPVAAREREPMILQIAEADLAAQDAHRVQLSMSIDRLSPDIRNQMLGNCILSFPADGDDRPVQHIPRIRGFVADLHRRMPYFPIFLCLDPRASMHMIYFGCLGAAEATQLLGDNEAVGTDVHHPSILSATKAAIIGMRDACKPRGIDWQSCAEEILAPYDPETAETLRAPD